VRRPHNSSILSADQPLAPIEYGRFGHVPSGHLGRIRLDLTSEARFATDSPLEGTGFEPLVPRKALGVLAVSALVRADSSSAGMKRHVSCFRNRGRVTRYRRFESDFFQRPA
jgi:hypothetical protein